MEIRKVPINWDEVDRADSKADDKDRSLRRFVENLDVAIENRRLKANTPLGRIEVKFGFLGFKDIIWYEREVNGKIARYSAYAPLEHETRPKRYDSNPHGAKLPYELRPQGTDHTDIMIEQILALPPKDNV